MLGSGDGKRDGSLVAADHVEAESLASIGQQPRELLGGGYL